MYGSTQHMMQEMFMSAKRPFYQSTQILTLDAVERGVYYEFASQFFVKKGLSLKKEIFEILYDEFDGHTWYIQAILNRLYGYSMNVGNSEILYTAINELVEEGVYAYQNLVNAYSLNAIKLMKAIAKEGFVK